MQKWVYRERTGTACNPVCEDAGEIIDIFETSGYYTYGAIGEILCKDDTSPTGQRRFYCDTKPYIVRAGGFCSFDPELVGEEEKFPFVEKPFPQRLKDGDKFLPELNVHYRVDGYECWYGCICTDPRVIYMLIATVYWKDDAKRKYYFDKFKKQIPTKEEAIDFLKKYNIYQNPCLHWDDAKEKINRNFDKYCAPLDIEE